MFTINKVLAFAVLFLAGLTAALPEPHAGMVDTAEIRDVGIIYTKPNYQGKHDFVYQIKSKPDCLALGNEVSSIQICKTDVACTFYTGSNCVKGPSNFGVLVGCGDVAEVATPKGRYFNHYTCGPKGKMPIADMALETTPHNTTLDVAAAMA